MTLRCIKGKKIGGKKIGAIVFILLPQIVFATAYDQYAVRAFDVNAVDYLLKPFDRARVQQALERARGRIADSSQGALPESVKVAPLTGTNSQS